MEGASSLDTNAGGTASDYNCLVMKRAFEFLVGDDLEGSWSSSPGPDGSAWEVAYGRIGISCKAMTTAVVESRLKGLSITDDCSLKTKECAALG